MPDIDFVMTYPCFFLLNENGNPESVIIDGLYCLCLFTDFDLVESFYKSKYGNHFVTKEIDALRCDDRGKLVSFLREEKSNLAEQNVQHLAIDTTPGKMTMCVDIQEFINEN